MAGGGSFTRWNSISFSQLSSFAPNAILIESVFEHIHIWNLCYSITLPFQPFKTFKKAFSIAYANNAQINKLTSVCYAPVLLLIINCVITLSKWIHNKLWQCYDCHQEENRRTKIWRQFAFYNDKKPKLIFKQRKEMREWINARCDRHKT